MKKVFIILTSLIGVSIVSLYVLLFTSFGNSLTASVLEDYLNKKGIVSFKLDKFKLTFDEVSLKASIDKNSHITLTGNYDLFSQRIDLKYLLDIKDLSKLENFTKQKLVGSLALVGKVQGDKSKLLVQGRSNVFGSNTIYDMQLNDMNPKYITVNIQDAKIEQILSLSNQKNYASGIIDIDVNIKDTNVNSLNGIVSLDIKNALLNHHLLNTKFKQKIKKAISINGKIYSKLVPNQIISKININSNLAKLNIQKNIIRINEKEIKSDFQVIINKFSDLSDFIDTKSTKGFEVNGNIIANEKDLRIKGQSDIFQGVTTYDISLKDKKLKELILDLKFIKIDELLALVQQPIYVKGKANISANIINAKLGELDGKISIETKNSMVNKNILNNEFSLKLKKDIRLDLKLNSDLLKDTVSSALTLKSSLLNLSMPKLDVNLKSENIKSDYTLNIQNLRNLYGLIGMKLNGAFNLTGHIQGSKEKASIHGLAKIFDSNPSFDLNLENLNPSSVKFKVQNARLEKVLYTLNQPSYSKGLIDINADVLNLNPETLKGNITTEIKKGYVNNKTVNKLFDLKLKNKVLFESKTNTNLQSNKLLSTIQISSNIANIKSKSTVVNTDDLSLQSDYEVSVKDLEALYDLSQTKMRGSIVLNGNIKKGKTLEVQGKSNFLNGTFDFNLLDDKLTANIKGIQTKDLLHMLYYPIVFDSSAQSTLNYNLKSQKGNVNTILENGKILETKYTSTIRSITKFDLTREAYTKSTLKSTINKKIINSTLDMDSKNTEIDVPNSIVNLKARTISALLQTRLDNIEFDTKISGSLDKPKVKIQTDKLIKSTVKTKVYKEIEKKILEKTGSDAVKSLLKGFFQ